MTVGLKRAALVLTALGLSACGSDGRTFFGFDRSIPDEFAVVTRAPLSMPPEFRLPPPNPGAPRPQEAGAAARAAETLFGGTALRPAPLPAAESAGQSALLAQAGAGNADPDIRRLVDQEAAAMVEADQSLIDRLIFWQEPLPPGTVVDPAGEARRLAGNQALGRPITEGEVPVVVRERRAPLEGLLN